MQIFCDDIPLLNRLFSHNIEHIPGKVENEPKNLQPLIKKVYTNRPYYTAHLEQSSLWSCLFIVNHSEGSHFDLIQDMLKNGVEIPDKVLFFAGSGDGFIGFKNRTWVADRGNMHLTAFLKPARTLEYLSTGFTVIAAVSVIQVLDKYLPVDKQSKIRWVNDIVIQNKKIAGVLTRIQVQGTHVESAQIGTGINVESVPLVKQDLFVPQVTSLSEYASISLDVIFSDYIDQLYNNYQLYLSGAYEQLWQCYAERSVITGKYASVYSDPYTGQTKLMVSGVVERIGMNLELYIKGHPTPVTRGRVVIKDELIKNNY